MSYRACEDCGNRIYSHGCTWCNEEEYIEMQDAYPDENEIYTTKEQSK